jgi:hypothetical protein
MNCQICGYTAEDRYKIYPLSDNSYIEVTLCRPCKHNLTDYEAFQLVIEQNKLIAKGEV